MKALVIRQPWASLVVGGGKTIENRTWTTKHRGPLAIVAGSMLASHEHQQLAAALGSELDPTELPRGFLIGIVDLVDIVTDSQSKWAMPGCFHWVLANARHIKPQPIKGRLGLFNVEIAE